MRDRPPTPRERLEDALWEGVPKPIVWRKVDRLVADFEFYAVEAHLKELRNKVRTQSDLAGDSFHLVVNENLVELVRLDDVLSLLGETRRK